MILSERSGKVKKTDGLLPNYKELQITKIKSLNSIHTTVATHKP